jgi:microcystin degradation protein MlrC
MRLIIAMMQHETNTFSPVPTPLARFARGNTEPVPYEGDAAIEAFRDTGTALGGFIEVAEQHGAEIICPIAASAWPSGVVEDTAYDYMTDKICAAVAMGCDGILLHLHGAMVTQSLVDGEGPLIKRLRELAPDTPMGVALDMHTNFYPDMATYADVIAGYQTYPHVDIYETGVRASKPIIAMIKDGIRPTMAWGNRPMLPHVMRQGSGDFPNQELQAMAQRMEADGALSASFFTGFPHADIELAGSSAVVVTNNDMALAEKMRDELLDFAWDNRRDFIYEIEPLGESLARAKKLALDSDASDAEGPIVLLDHYDNAASGGSMDTMKVLEGILEAGLTGVAFFAVFDPDAVQQLIQAGIGHEATIALGGKTDLDAIKHKATPLEVTGRVKLISDGRFKNHGPMSAGMQMDMGPTVVFDTGNVEIIVISSHLEPHDEAAFLTLGIDPARKKFLGLKSRVHWRAGFKHIASETIDCAGIGVCTSDYDMLDFKHVRRPIFPLDQVNDPSSTNG